MANWYYYESNGNKQGPITNAQLKTLAASGIIKPTTILETEDGKQGRAGKVNGLQFPTQHETTQVPVPVPSAVSNSRHSAFCTNCGNGVHPKATACPSCGVPPKLEKRFCNSCGKPILNPNQVVCTNCGIAIAVKPSSSGRTAKNKNKNKITAGIFALLLGGFGAQRFYLGQIGWGIVCILCFWTYIPALIGLIEGVRLLTMSDEDFDEKYNS